MQTQKQLITPKLLLQIFLCTLKIGAFTFGGGYAMIAIMQREFVTKRGWVEETDILDIFAISQSIPGAIALNSSVFIGYRVAGTWGAIAAALGISLPSLIVLSVVSLFYVQFKDNRFVAAALLGVRACVVALIASSAITLGKPAIKDITGGVIFVIAFVLAAVFDVNAVYIILGAGLSGFVLYKLRGEQS